MPMIRTIFQPDMLREVDDAEAAQLGREGLLMPPEPEEATATPAAPAAPPAAPAAPANTPAAPTTTSAKEASADGKDQ